MRVLKAEFGLTDRLLDDCLPVRIIETSWDTKWSIFIGQGHGLDYEVSIQAEDDVAPIGSLGRFRVQTGNTLEEKHEYTIVQRFDSPRINQRFMVKLPGRRRRSKSNPVPAKNFRIRCTVDIDHTDPIPPNLIASRLFLKDLENLSLSGKHHDMVFHFLPDHEEVKAHRVIIASGSDVFEAMFHNWMRERIEGVVYIVDIEPVIIQALLYFIYTGNYDLVDNSEPEEFAFVYNLLVAANKYMIFDLADHCAERLGEIINDDNVFSILEGAKFHSLSALETIAESYIESANHNEEASQTTQDVDRA